MANDVRVRIQADDKASKVIQGVGQSAENAVKPLGEVGKIAAGFVIGQGLTQLPNLIGGMVSSASDLAESASKVNVVFGKMAPPVQEFSRLADAIGLSDQQALAATGTFGNLFVSMGMSQQEAANMSVDIVKLAADLASFNNIGVDEALEKLRAGLVGETEPLRALGVNLSAAAVESKALEMGLAATKGELTAADKATASYKLILEQTTTAQGDFERTSGGLANKQRMLKADVADLQAEIGQKLVPAFDAAVTAGSGFVDLAGKVEPSTAGIAALGTAALVAAPHIVRLGSSVGDLVDDLGKGERNLNTFGTRLGALTVGLIAADVASQAFTGRSLTERVFGDVAKSEAAESAISALDAKVQALGTNADRAAAATDLLWETNARLGSGAVKAEQEVGGFMNVLTGSDGRIFGFNVGASEAVDNMKDMEAAAKLAGAEMRAQGVPLDELIVAYQELNPELRDAFDAGSNVTAAWVEATGGLTGLANVLPEVKAAYDELKPSTEGVGEATSNNLDPLTKWGEQVATNTDGTKDWEGALKGLLATLTDADPRYLGLQANMALVKDEMAELALKGDDLTQAEKDRLAVLEGTLANLELAKGAYDANNEALDRLTGSVKAYVGDDVAGALIKSMQDTGQPADTMVEKFGAVQKVYDHLESNDIPGAVRAFDELQDKLTEDEWATGARAVGEDVVAGIRKGVSDPAQQQQLVNDIQRTTDTAIGEVDPFPEGTELGLGIVSGVSKGIEQGAPSLFSQLNALAKDAVKAAKAAIDSKSPSKVFANEVGIPIAEGVALGIKQGAADYVIPTIEEMAENATALAATKVAGIPGQNVGEMPGYTPYYTGAGSGGKGVGVVNGNDYPIPFGEMTAAGPAVGFNEVKAQITAASGRVPTDDEVQRVLNGMLDQDMMALAFNASDYVGGSYLDYHSGKALLAAKGQIHGDARGTAVMRGSGRGAGGGGPVIVINAIDAASFREALNRGLGEEIMRYASGRRVFA